MITEGHYFANGCTKKLISSWLVELLVLCNRRTKRCLTEQWQIVFILKEFQEGRRSTDARADLDSTLCSPSSHTCLDSLLYSLWREKIFEKVSVLHKTSLDFPICDWLAVCFVEFFIVLRIQNMQINFHIKVYLNIKRETQNKPIAKGEGK